MIVNQNPPQDSLTPDFANAHEAFRKFVLTPDFPCVGARAAINAGSYGFGLYPELAASDTTAALARDLRAFQGTPQLRDHEYATFAAVFQRPKNSSEAEFEKLLWDQLNALHRIDPSKWDSEVSANPDDPHFSFSFAGAAFYVLGMHPGSSRAARRFLYPALMFNPHAQFERLRSDGKWRRMRETIRERDIALQGSINPMLSDFGERSEARQYSGRVVENDWQPPGKCPFGH